MSSVATSNFGDISDIQIDLFGSKTNTNSEDALLQSLLKRYRIILSNKLRPFQDVLPMADSTIQGDLHHACNLLVEMEWHRIKTHWDDFRNCKTSFDLTWESIVDYLKALPTARTQPVSVSGDLASSSTLLQNIPNMTDANGNILPGF